MMRWLRHAHATCHCPPPISRLHVRRMPVGRQLRADARRRRGAAHSCHCAQQHRLYDEAACLRSRQSGVDRRGQRCRRVCGASDALKYGDLRSLAQARCESSRMTTLQDHCVVQPAEHSRGLRKLSFAALVGEAWTHICHLGAQFGSGLLEHAALLALVEPAHQPDVLSSEW
jgi:hypothetical protein